MTALRDFDIRQALHNEFLSEYHDDPDTMILDEFGICRGEARVDIVVVNGALHGIEIKSERDTLDRLPGQAEAYGKVFDTVTLVASGRHIAKLDGMVPKWWGIVQVTKGDGPRIAFETIREPSPNRRIDAFSVAQLLWKDEALLVLADRGLEKGYLSKPCNAIWAHMVSCIPTSELQHVVREAIKARANWRSDRQPT